MRIVPVLDIVGGVVVRGVAGQRSLYRPIESRLCRSTNPASIARAIKEHFGLIEFYLADLDAIAGGEPAFAIYESVAATGARLWIDAGVGDEERARALAKFRAAGSPLAGVIVGLESLVPPNASNTAPTADELQAALGGIMRTVGRERMIFSVDLKVGQPLTHVPEWRALSPLEIAGYAVGAGARRLIILDLADVGVSGGVGTLALCQALRAQHPDVEIIAGGGVRGPADLQQMADAGCDAALVASALHDGRLTKEMLVAE